MELKLTGLFSVVKQILEREEPLLDQRPVLDQEVEPLRYGGGHALAKDR
jgi:hypothetical protein